MIQKDQNQSVQTTIPCIKQIFYHPFSHVLTSIVFIATKGQTKASENSPMALVVYCYDFICFGVVAAALIASLWVLWKKEAASRCDEESVYESLLEARPDADGFIRATPRAHVGSNQLWTSCWIRVHPGWLVLTRFVSFAVMAGFLAWDIVEWDTSIFVYYTE